MKRIVTLLIAAALTSPLIAAPIKIGVEYAPPGMGKSFGDLGISVAKPYPDSITWGSMQATAKAGIDFRQMDRFVREYQAAGFRDLVLVLKARSLWGSRDFLKNFAPKAEHVAAFEAWVKAVVERYDKDGRDDMPGLKWPVRYYILGSEFSTFEPTPTDDYLDTLERTYKSAHAAYDKVVVMPAGFLVTTVFRDRPTPAKYEAAFAAASPRILHKTLADIRKVLDKPKLFDAINFHALGDPYEIEDIVTWLRWEMARRKYTKPILITDTAPTPFIAWGPATKDKGPEKSLGLIIPPATEADRPRLARYFTKLVENDPDTTAFNHAFVAADMIKKTVVAAERGVEMINTSFMEDLWPMQLPLMGGGAGTSAWAGMAKTKMNVLTQERTVQELRPGYYAIARLHYYLKDYDKVERVKTAADAQVRLYRFNKGPRPTWVGWVEPGKVLLPGDKVPSVEVSITAPGMQLVVEKMIDRAGVTKPEQSQTPVRDGTARLTLTPVPVFVTPGR